MSKVVKFGNNYVRKINNKHLEYFNGEQVKSVHNGFARYDYEQSGTELTIRNSRYSQSDSELIIE